MFTAFRDSPLVDDLVNSFFTSARNWVEPGRDPLVLDLNGSGITTSGINPAAPLYFDHAGDGVPNATGWVGAGEGLVVRDLNGNGRIDSGRELFGDNTVLTTGANAGKNATDGFAALRDLDSNADGKFDASDAAFSSVKIWKDLNQNAISETGELFTLADAGVQSISLSASASNLNLGGGNTQTFTGSFTRVGGGTGTAGTAELVGNLLLANNNFYRQFNDDPALTPEARVLPGMQGSGWVRDLRPAMSPIQADSSSATVMPNASAIFSILSSEILRTCRSTWAMKVRCSSASNAKSSCDQPRSCRSLTMFTANRSRAQRRLRAGLTSDFAGLRGIDSEC